LFTELPKQTEKRFVGAINADDATGQRWLESGVDGIKFGQTGNPNLHVDAMSVKVDSIYLVVAYDKWPKECNDIVPTVKLGGSYNVENTAAAVAGVIALGYGSSSEIANALRQVRPVPGRFEAVLNELDIGVLVDYAHTPDALEKLLDAVRPLTTGRIITVFGCGGDRDRTKRPKMAKAASERSDVTVVTSDNPRTEDPQFILNEVLTGVVPGRESIDIIDRREAIAHAIKIANPGDVVVIAGKGHENYQIIGRTKYPMDDRVMAREALEAR
jgi:UDP-N-acetylmuramoyl-L-alanyl-D-glutamate--2,6-diaminopimelate ligase